MTFEPVRIGVAGLGRAFMLTLPAFKADERVRLVAACAPRAESRRAFEAEFGGRTYRDIEGLCRDPEVEVVYVAGPHQLHCEHVLAAARAGRHVLVEKPLCLSVTEGRRMVAACRKAGTHLIVGPSHSFDAPVAQARAIVASGEFGAARMIQALNYTDFLYRPRRPEELKTEEGGGVIYSQAIHQVDVVTLLAGAPATSVTAMSGAWDAQRPSEGAYAALIGFDNGCFASLAYSGFAHFDSDEWMGGIGELGRVKRPDAYGAAKRALGKASGSAGEIRMKTDRTFGRAAMPEPATSHEHFGPMIVLCDRADLRLTPDGVEVYGDSQREFRPAAPLRHARREVMDAVVAAVRDDMAPVQSGERGLACLEICQAMLLSAQKGRPVNLVRRKRPAWGTRS